MSLLQVYVSAECETCLRAREIGEALLGAYPGISVEVVDVGRVEAGAVPDAVIAVPTYLLDGVVVSLGNPNLASFREKLAAVALGQG